MRRDGFERAVANERLFIDARTTAATSVVMSTASVAARMTASARAPAAKILPAAEALRRVPAAMEILRRVPAAKQMEAARMRRLVGGPRKAPAHRGPRRPRPEIGTLKAC